MSANKKDSTVKPAKNMYQTKEKVLAELHAENVVSKFNTPSPECAKVKDSKAMRMIIVEQLSDFDKTPETAAHTTKVKRKKTNKNKLKFTSKTPRSSPKKKEKSGSMRSPPRKIKS